MNWLMSDVIYKGWEEETCVASPTHFQDRDFRCPVSVNRIMSFPKHKFPISPSNSRGTNEFNVSFHGDIRLFPLPRTCCSNFVYSRSITRDPAEDRRYTRPVVFPRRGRIWNIHLFRFFRSPRVPFLYLGHGFIDAALLRVPFSSVGRARH
jgi:hypothetical protein